MAPIESPEVMAERIDQLHREMVTAHRTIKELRADFQAAEKARREERERLLWSGLKLTLTALGLVAALVWGLRKTVVEGGQ